MAQGTLGVAVANVSLLVGVAVLEPTWRAPVAALVMAVLSPVTAELGRAGSAGEGDAHDMAERRQND